MPKMGIEVPTTLRPKVAHYLSTKNLSEDQFAQRCGLSFTCIHRLLNGERNTISKYALKRINAVVNNGETFYNAEKRTRSNVSIGPLTPVPAWIIPPLREYAANNGGMSVVGKKIGVDGSALGKVVKGEQSQMRESNVKNLVEFFRAELRNGGCKITATHVKVEPLPPQVHALEMNQIVDAYNGWTDTQREAFSNFAHAFRCQPLDVSAYKSRIAELEKDLASAEADATKWQNEYEKVAEKLKAISRTLA